MTAGATLYLVSACGTAEEFVAAFRRYADRTGLFIPSSAPLPAGRRGRLALTLKDGGVMIEGEAEILQSSARPSVLHGRPGMTVKFVEPDDLSKTVIGELEKARLAMKPAPPSVPPRPANVPAEPRPLVPAVGGRIDAANALAECVVIGDPAQLVDTASAPRSVNDAGSGKAKFVVPSIPGVGGSRPNSPSTPPPMRANTPSTPPPVGEPRAKTPSIPPDPASKPLPAPVGKSSKMTSVGFPVIDKMPAFPPKTNVPGATPTPAAPTQQTPTHTGPAPAPPSPAPAPATAAAAPAENPLLQTKMGVKPAANRTKEQAAEPEPAENSLLSTQRGTQAARASMNATTHGMPALAKEPARPTPAAGTPPPTSNRAISVNEEATTIGEAPPKPDPATPAAVAKQPSAPTPAPVAKQPSEPTPVAAKQPSPAAAPPQRQAPTPHAKSSKPTSIGFAAVRTPFETQPVGTVRPPPGTAPVAPPIVPDGNSARPGAGAPGPRGKNATRPPLTPRHPTPVAPVPIVRSPAKAAPLVEDAIVENAIVEEEKTDLSEVPVPPSRTSGTEDTVDAAKAETIDANVDPHANTQIATAPQRSGGMRASEIMAAIPSGDWTMAPDASGPTVVGGAPAPAAETPVVIESKQPPKGPPTGNWSISLDPDVGWSEPVKLEKSPEAPKPEPKPKQKARKGTGTAGNPDKAIADEKGFMAQEWEEKPTGIGEAKIEIDSTLMEPLKPMPALDDDADPLSDPPAAGSMPRLATVDGKQITYITPPAGHPVVADDPSPFAAPPLAAPSPGPYPTPASGMAAASPFATAGASPYANAPPPMTSPVAVAAGYSSTGMPVQSNLFAHSPPAASMGVAPADYSGAAATPTGSRKRTIIIGIAAIAALAAGFVLVLVLAGGKDKKQTANNDGKGSGSAAAIDTGSGSASGAGSGATTTTQTGSGSAEPAIAVGSGSGSAEIEIDEPAGSGSAAVVETPDTKPEVPTGGPCKVTVTSAPSGADVYQGTEKLGKTPLETELPCGVEAKLTLKKPKFINTGKAFTPAEGKANKLAVKLAKPTFTLKITSTPAGATITVGGKSMGVTPATIRLPAFEAAGIKVTKPGYAGESKSVTPKSNNLSQHFVLKKGRR